MQIGDLPAAIKRGQIERHDQFKSVVRLIFQRCHDRLNTLHASMGDIIRAEKRKYLASIKSEIENNLVGVPNLERQVLCD